MNIFIEPMTTEHIPEVTEIEKKSFSMPWSREAFLESFSYDHALFLAATDLDENKRVVGYIGMYKILNEGDITNIAVSPEYRGRGVGFALMKSLEELAAKRNIENLILEVRESNYTAIGLYEKAGFSKMGMRRNFYEKPREDAIVMYKKLLPL